MGGAEILPPTPASTLPRTWTAGVLNPGTAGQTVAGVASNEDGSILVAGEGGQGYIYYSYDQGATWTKVQVRNDGWSCQAPAFGNGQFLIGGQDIGTTLYTSADGKNWFGSSVPNVNDSFYFAYGLHGWVGVPTGGLGIGAAHGVVIYGAPGVWSQTNKTPNPPDIPNCSWQGYSVCFDGANIVIPGHDITTNESQVAYTAGGDVWNTITLSAVFNSYIQYLFFGQGQYLGVDNNGNYILADSFGGLENAEIQRFPVNGGAQIVPVAATFLPEGRLVVLSSTGNIVWSLDQGATWSADVPSWHGYPTGACSWAPIATFGENIAAAVNNAQEQIAVRGVNC